MTASPPASHSAPSLEGPLDRLTLAALAVVAYALANLLHEVLGHGGACLLVGGHLTALSAVHAGCDIASAAAAGTVTAAGTVMNLCAGGLAWLLLRRQGDRLTHARYFAWLFMTVNLLQAAGYWLFSGLMGVGDWAALTAPLRPLWLYRSLLALAGGVGYWSAIVLSLRHLNTMLGDGANRLPRARTLALVPYFTGGALYVAAGVLNPVSPRLVIISAAAASFGGTSALAWMTRQLATSRFPAGAGPALTLGRSWAWLAAACVTLVVFVAVLGPGLRF